MRPSASSERAVILAPTGRDASVAAGLIREAGYYANVCGDLPALLLELEGGAGLAVIADEAIKTADLRSLVNWLTAQPSWSDFPIVLLTHQGGGPERNPDAMRIGQILGNVTFIERPFHPTTLVSVVGSAVRGRRRQYQTRAILADLTESEGLLQTALNAGRLGALELHLPEFELEASDTCKAFFGRGPREPFSYQDLLAAVHPDDRARRRELLEKAIETGRDYGIEYRNIWPDGSLHWVDVRARAVRRPDGSIKSLVGVSSDITARKTADIERENLLAQLAAERTALAELTATLEQRVEQRSAELMKEVAAREKVQEQLRQAQKMEAIGQLTGGVAHDFNNLLQALTGNLDLIHRLAQAHDDARLLQLTANAQRATARGARLTQQLLAFSRRQNLNPEQVWVHRLVAEMDELLRRAVGETVQVEARAAPDLWPCHLDPAQFESAVLNLAINARDAMPDGGTLAIVAGNMVLDIAAASRLEVPPGDYVRVDVSDTGTGIAPEHLSRLFEPFFTTKEVGKGTGLGLAMVHGFARQSGGTVTVSSAPGRGTTVSLLLPRSPLPARPTLPEPRPPAAVPHGSDPRRLGILVVEDDPEVREAVQFALVDAGHRVLTAADAPDALAVLQNGERLDVLVCDVGLPGGISGLEVARAARRLRPQLRVLLASGYGDDATAGDGYEMMAKPFSQAELLRRVAATDAAAAAN